MKKSLLIITLCFSQITWGASLEFKKVGLVAFSESVFKDFLKADYVISNDVLETNSTVSMSVKNLDKEQTLQVVKNVLKDQGIVTTVNNGIYYLTKGQDNEKPSPHPQDKLHNNGYDKTTSNIRGNDGLSKSTDKADSDATTGKPQVTHGCNDSGCTNSGPNDKASSVYSYAIRYRKFEELSKIVKLYGSKTTESETGSILAFTAKDDKEAAKITQILKAVDSKPNSITVRALLLEFNQGSNESRAFNFASAATILADKLNISIGSKDILQNSAKFSGHHIDAVISAISGDNHFSYLSNPLIRVIDGEKAKLVVGSEVPTRGVSTVDRNGNIIQSFVYRSSGVQINVEPTIKDDYIQLRVNQQLSSFVLTTTSTIDSPTLNKREAETVLDIKRGETIILAGIDEDKTTTNESGVPFFPSWLRDKQKTSTKSQILLLLEVLEDPT